MQLELSSVLVIFGVYFLRPYIATTSFPKHASKVPSELVNDAQMFVCMFILFSNVVRPLNGILLTPLE